MIRQQIAEMMVDVSRQLNHRVGLILESQETSSVRNYNDLAEKNADLTVDAVKANDTIKRLELRNTDLEKKVMTLKQERNPEAMHKLEKQNLILFDKLHVKNKASEKFRKVNTGLQRENHRLIEEIEQRKKEFQLIQKQVVDLLADRDGLMTENNKLAKRTNRNLLREERDRHKETINRLDDENYDLTKKLKLADANVGNLSNQFRSLRVALTDILEEP